MFDSCAVLPCSLFVLRFKIIIGGWEYIFRINIKNVPDFV